MYSPGLWVLHASHPHHMQTKNCCCTDAVCVLHISSAHCICCQQVWLSVLGELNVALLQVPRHNNGTCHEHCAHVILADSEAGDITCQPAILCRAGRTTRLNVTMLLTGFPGRPKTSIRFLPLQHSTASGLHCCQLPSRCRSSTYTSIIADGKLGCMVLLVPITVQLIVF